MKVRVGFLMYLLLTSMLIQANDTIPQVIPEGRWEVVQVTVEKNTDDTVETNVYDKAEEVKSDILCPQEWEIKEAPQGVLLRYANGNEIFFDYAIEDSLLIITIGSVTHSYRYEINGEELILMAVFEQPGMNVENWTITLKRKKQINKN